MYRVLKIGSAFIGVIVGAGFASGQEMLQYFTSFGMWGTVGAVVATALFAYLGMMLTRLGSRVNAMSHKDVVYKISGKRFGIIIDGVIIMTLFVVGTVMLAGAGSNLEQQFGLPAVYGSFLLVILVMLTVILDIPKVINIISSITPLLVIAVLAASAYSIFTMDLTFEQLTPYTKEIETNLPNWIIATINYVSFNIAVGASMAFVIGGAEDNERIAAWGGFLGGLALGVMIILSHLALFSQVNVVGDKAMPMLAIINQISPYLGILLSIVLYAMIFNTAVGMFYAFGARFVELGTRKFNIFLFITVMIGFALSFLGFTELVRYFYPIVGYLGLFLIGALLFATFRMPKKESR